MALVVFESRVNMLTVATPSIGGYVLGYDSADGILKQKNDQGVISTVAGSTPVGSLAQTLAIGNSTGTFSINLGANTKISSVMGGGQLRLDNGIGGANIVNLSTDYGVLTQSYLYMTSNSLTLRSLNASLLFSATSAIFQLNSSNVSSFSSNNYYVSLNGLRVIDFTTATSSTTVGNKISALISTNNSKLNTGVYNTVVLGGTGITGATSNSVYVPNLYVQDGGFIKGINGLGQLVFNMNNEIYLSSNTNIIGILGANSEVMANYNGIFITDNTDTIYTNPISDNTFISTSNTSVDAGLNNVIVIGGDGLYVTQSNTTYIGGTVDINNQYKLPTSDGLSGQVIQTDGMGNTYWGNGGNLVEITAASFSVLIIFEPNTTYKILDANISLYGGTEIYLTTNASGVLNETGVGKFYNPLYDQGLPGFGIWSSTGTYYVNDTVFWGGMAWINTSGDNSLNIDMFTLNSDDWDAITFDDTNSQYYYNISYDEIKYDWQNDLIIYRNEKNSNIVSFTKSVLYELQLESDIFHPIKGFQWGNMYNPTTGIGIGRQNITNSYNENINFRGHHQIDFIFANYSKQFNCLFTPGSYQQNIVMYNQSYQSNLILDNSSQQHISLDNESWQDGISLYNYSTQRNINFDDTSYQESILIDNDSIQSHLNFQDNAKISSLNLDSGVEQHNIRMENVYIDRGGVTITTNENDLTYAPNKHLFGNDFLIKEALSNVNIKGTLNYTLATASGTFNASGEAVYYGTAPYGLTAGYLYANIGGTWSDADNKNNYFYQLGIALGATPSIDGMLIKGFVYAPFDMYVSTTVGSPQYISGNVGQFIERVPASDYIRVIGHIAQNRILHFNPDNIWLKKTNFDL